MIGNCNLCKETKELQRVCHVIPDFFYRENNLFHEHHNLVYIDLQTLLKTGEKKIISNKQKTGEYDLNKLCKGCDGNIIGGYESYTREFFYAEGLPIGKELILTDKNGYIECSNVDYTKLKLLFLSILWRAALSNRPVFSEIKIDDNISEELRKMILNGEPKKDTEFPVFFINTFFDKTISSDYLIQPIRMKVANEDGFMFAFGGMIVTFTKGIDGIPDFLLKYRIQENGIFRTLKVPPDRTWKLIIDWYQK